MCGGDAVVDDCGVCDGDGTSCVTPGCDGADVCLSLDGNALTYQSSSDIYGFQFNHTGCVTDAYGGESDIIKHLSAPTGR